MLQAFPIPASVGLADLLLTQYHRVGLTAFCLAGVPSIIIYDGCWEAVDYCNVAEGLDRLGMVGSTFPTFIFFEAVITSLLQMAHACHTPQGFFTSWESLRTLRL